MTCAGLTLTVEVGLHTVGLRRTARLLGVGLSRRQAPTDPPPLLPAWTRRRIRTATRVTQRSPYGPEGKCLRTALVQGQRLRTLSPELVLGVRRVDGAVLAHAWLQVAGGSLDPTAAEHSQLPVRGCARS